MNYMSKFARNAAAMGVAALLLAAPTYSAGTTYNPVDVEYSQRAPPAQKPTKPTERDRGSLRGSSTSMREQNDAAKFYGLSKIKDNEELYKMIKGEYLVKVPARGKGYYLDNDLTEVKTHSRNDPRVSRDYVRPYTLLFLRRFSEQYSQKCPKPFKVTSLVRTSEDQKFLGLFNLNASKKGTHPTGANIDISTNSMCGAGIKWASGVLSSLDRNGYLEATREKLQPHFHTMVYPSYVDYVRSITAPQAPKK